MACGSSNRADNSLWPVTMACGSSNRADHSLWHVAIPIRNLHKIMRADWKTRKAHHFESSAEFSPVSIAATSQGQMYIQL